MDIVRDLKDIFADVERAKSVASGLIIELRTGPDADQNWIANRYKEISTYLWNEHNELVYSLYKFQNDLERFALDGTLRTQRTQQSFNMSTSVLTASDVFGKFTRFDFDVLTLADRDGKTTVLFRLDDASPSRHPTSTTFLELDLQGHQFSTSAKPIALEGGIFSITTEPGIDFPF